MSYTEGQQVLILWGPASPPEAIKSVVEEVSQKVGQSGKVQVEHIDRLTLSNHQTSQFDVAVSGQVHPATSVHSSEVLAELAKILKPGATLCLREPTTSNGSQLRTAEKVQSALKLAGFIDVTQTQTVNLSDDEKQSLKSALSVDSPVILVEFSAKKPDYEVGASAQLNLPWVKKTTEPKVSENAAQVWTLSANDIMDDDVELMDSDDLLDEDDLKKPDPSSLRVCGTTGKRKACKNCSCGLAEELDAEAAGNTNPTTTKNATSACGNCYLGDAFRCASCPYLGMPAFKPGEKVQLSTRQLNADQ